MILFPSVFRPSFGDEIVLNSVDWLENFPWRQENVVKTEKDKYEICLNVKDFSPKDLTVKTADGFIVIEGKHDEKKDEIGGGYISRHFVRRYTIPEDCISDKLQSRLSPDGVLTVSAPRKHVVKRDTVIPVSHEGSKAKAKL